MTGLVQEYASDSDDSRVPTPTVDDAFGLFELPAAKRQRTDNSLNNAVGASIAPDDALNQASLVTRPTDTQIMVNIKIDDMLRPAQGPENPFADRRFQNQNALAGVVEEQAMTERDFRAQHLSYSILGYAANPSFAADVPVLGSLAAAKNNNFQTLDMMRATSGERKQWKRKRNDRGDLEIVDGEGAYAGPWAKWAGDEQPEMIVPEQDEEPEEENPEFEARKIKARRQAFGQEKSIFHGKSVADYQGRTYMHPPVDIAPNLAREEGSQECFLPKECIHTWTGHTGAVSVVRLLPKTGHLLLSGSMDTRIKARLLLWDVYHEGNCLRTFMGHHKAIKDLTFSNDGRRFLSASHDRLIKLWDTETGQCLKAFSNGKTPHVVKFHPDEDKQHIFLAGMHDKKIVQWDINTSEIVQEYDQHLGAVNTITFVDENRRFVTTSDDKTIRAWDFDIPVVIKYIAEPHMHSMPAVTLHPTGKWFAAQSLDNQILVYSADTFRQNRKKRFAGHSTAGYACAVGFSPDGRWISSGDADGSIVFWDWKTGRLMKRLRAHSKVVICHEWLPHETSKVVTGSWDGLIKLWD
ncbi:pre-mRNA splicing factor [Dacryopinax primogenitus]|uniref:Pre-mRNA-processing factor 17 n=1 Tax=Dacryopinax primogenitus (strain DJM 731) TaxID=1858805 RepID=M5FNU6_DACPD|nr:pre-mRNA splicing factor [Dacryopinax primogenitus]EJT97940.1 pre-mRNA splicing factor [Dacryopinax primogenitus]